MNIYINIADNINTNNKGGNKLDTNNEHNSDLAMNTLDSIPNPNSNAKTITALIKHSGEVTGYQLSDGSTISKEEGIELAKAGQISGVGIAHREDTEYLKSLPDDIESNNLSSLPTINQ